MFSKCYFNRRTPSSRARFSRIAFVSGTTAAMLALTPAFAGGPVETNLSVFEASVYDRDGDGYAAYYSNRSNRESYSSLDINVPGDWVEKRGDLDDSDPNVHPRRPEVYGNGIDDDCDGRTDEAEFRYYHEGNHNTTSGFTMEVKINDADVMDAFGSGGSFGSRLYYRVEYQNLRNTGNSHLTELKQVTSMITRGLDIELCGLSADQVYRARVRFYEKDLTLVGLDITAFGRMSNDVVDSGMAVLIGEESDWYYTTTDYDGTIANARTKAVLQGFYEYYLSEQLGLVGYLGETARDGRRYGGDLHEAWCSEFYAWVVSGVFDGMPTSSLGDGDFSQGHVFDYFGDHSGFFTESDLDGYESGCELDGFESRANRGDYLRTGNGDSPTHSCMFLAYDNATGEIWTLNGNGSFVAEEADGGYEDRLGGDEVSIKSIEIDRVYGWGKWKTAMIR